MSDAADAGPVASTEFRKLMGLFATGVCVVSFDNPDASVPHGVSAMTVNSLVSVSIDPMLVCWSLQNSSSQFDDYAGAEEFAISILAENQPVLARRYAARGDSALNPGDFERSLRGMPIVAGALGTIECRRWETYPAGDHTMVLGEVLAIDAKVRIGEHPRALAFFDGRFCSIASWPDQ